MTPAVHLLLTRQLMALGLADPDPAVGAGREALDRWWWQYPWYDARADGVERIEVSEPWYLRWDWFWDSFDFSGGGGLGSMSWLNWLAWIAIAMLLVLLVYLLIRAFKARERRRSAAAAGGAKSDAAEQRRRVEALPLEARRRRSNFLAEARRYYKQGDYREAIIYLFSYELVQLDKNQLIRLAKGKTNRQYLREVGRRITLRRLLEHTMVVFEDVFFGNYAIDRTRFESCWLQLGEFEALAAKGAA